IPNGLPSEKLIACQDEIVEINHCTRGSEWNNRPAWSFPLRLAADPQRRPNRRQGSEVSTGKTAPCNAAPCRKSNREGPEILAGRVLCRANGNRTAGRLPDTRRPDHSVDAGCQPSKVAPRTYDMV